MHELVRVSYVLRTTLISKEIEFFEKYFEKTVLNFIKKYDEEITPVVINYLSLKPIDIDEVLKKVVNKYSIFINNFFKELKIEISKLCKEYNFEYKFYEEGKSIEITLRPELKILSSYSAYTNFEKRMVLLTTC